MNEFLAFDDADWELASAYLDNEATPAERARVEASPALMGLVAELRSVQTSVAAPAPGAVDRDALIAAALAAAADEPTVGRVPGGTVLPAHQAVAPVPSIAGQRARRTQVWKTPMLLAAALLTVMGIGFALKSGSGSDSLKTSTAAVSVTTVSGAAKASAEPSLDTNAAPAAGDATTTAERAALPAAAATTAAAAATTAAPAAATTAAPAATVASAPTTTAPATAAAATTIVIAPTTGGPATTAVGPPVPTLTLQQLKDLVVSSAANPNTPSNPVCPDPRGVPRLSVQILWNGQPAIVFIDQINQTLVALAVNGCTPLANIPLKDVAQS
jgi:hypothetical protein